MEGKRWSNKKSVKQLTVFIIGVLCVTGMGMTALAEGSSRKNNIKSTGNIDFEEGKAYFASSDLLYLAEQVDTLEKTYKTSIVSALNSIGTYFKSDGSLTYDAGQNETDTDEEKIAIPFGQLTKGIIQSQSIDFITGIQVTDKDGNLLFYSSEEAKNKGNLLQTTTADTGMPVYYKAATVNNLTAGSAAWVNGVLVKGNGADNAAYYAQGFLDGQQNVTENLNITYQYHAHEGDESAVSGCYGEVTGYKPKVCGCPGWTGYNPEWGGCNFCKHDFGDHGMGNSSCNAVTGHTPYTYIGLVCGKTEDTIESATIIY